MDRSTLRDTGCRAAITFVIPTNSIHRFEFLPTTMSAKVLELNCLDINDPVERKFTIRVESSTNVSATKPMISDSEMEQALEHVGTDANPLALWKVSIPIDDNLKGD